MPVSTPENTLGEQARGLAERAKELHCLYAIARTLDGPERDLDAVLGEIVEIIPKAWLHAEQASARIVVLDREQRSARWLEDLVAVQHAPVIAHGEVVGAVEVGYPGPQPERDEGPFLNEERSLLNAIAQRLGEIVERKWAEQRLREHEVRLRSLAAELVRTEDRERRQIAEELHDRIGQTLASARIKVGMLVEEQPEGRLADDLRAVRDLIASAVADTRSLIFQISPPVLHQLGLGAALEWLTEEARRQYGLAVEFERPPGRLGLPEELRSALFRCARELVANAARHAQVETARVTLTEQDGVVRLSVADDGVGFDPEQVRARMLQTRTFGLFGLRERIEQLGGRVEVETAPGRGTRVTLAVPRGDRPGGSETR